MRRNSDSRNAFSVFHKVHPVAAEIQKSVPERLAEDKKHLLPNPVDVCQRRRHAMGTNSVSALLSVGGIRLQ